MVIELADQVDYEVIKQCKFMVEVIIFDSWSEIQWAIFPTLKPFLRFQITNVPTRFDKISWDGFHLILQIALDQIAFDE